MPLYKYKSLTAQGKSVIGTIDAPSVQEAKNMLKAKSLMPVSVELAELGGEKQGFLSKIFGGKVDSKSKIRFTKQLGVLLKSGIPLLQSIELLSEQFEGKLQRILFDVKDQLQTGVSFADALAKYPKVFSNIYIQLVRAGEATGKLDRILDRLNEYLEKSEETRKKFKSAMTYPIVLLSIAGLVVLGLLLFLVPVFANMFKQMQVTPPGMTEVLISASEFLKDNYLTIIIVFGFLLGIFFYWKSTARGKRILDELSLKLPLVSYLAKTKVVVQFSNTLGMLLDSGVNLAEALDIVCNIIDNSVLIDTLNKAREKIIKEGKIAQYLKETGIFPPIASYMIKTGEQSGQLPAMLLTVGHDYDIELNEMIDGLIAKINPVMLLVIGGVIILVVVGLFLPMFDIMEKIQ